MFTFLNDRDFFFTKIETFVANDFFTRSVRPARCKKPDSKSGFY